MKKNEMDYFYALDDNQEIKCFARITISKNGPFKIR
jgi:hypothetical protein